MKRATVLCLLAGSSSAFAQPFAFLKHHEVRPQASTIWSDGRLYIDAADLQPKKHQKGWAVFRASSPSLARLTSPLFVPLAESLDMNLVLVPIGDLGELDQLAPTAHEEGGACGSLEFIPQNYRLQSTQSLATPIFSSLASFTEIPSLLDAVDLSKIDATIAGLEQLTSRYHKHSVGITAPHLIADSWRSLASGNSGLTVVERAHVQTPQNSVIARMEGSTLPNETVVLGAHLDSISNRALTGPAPGADDNASGVAILQEILRLVETRGMRFQRSIEWQAYAAEEVGLIGSREIASAYRQDNKSLAGMLQFDMSYYSQLADAEGYLYFLEDFTSRDLRRSASDWINRYVGPYIRFGRMPAGSASDHKAWWEQGYSTLFAFENPLQFNPHAHSPEDKRLHFDNGLRVKRLAQLGLLFLIHQAGWTDLQKTYLDQSATMLPSQLRKDLFIAINPAEAAAYYLAISAPIEAETVEFCLVSSATALHCEQERETLSGAELRGDRKVFYQKNSFAFSAGQNWRIWAYDSTGKPVALRQINID